MKTKFLKKSFLTSLLALTIFCGAFGVSQTSRAQCTLDLSSPNNTATVSILAQWLYNDQSAALNPSYLTTTVLVGNAIITNGVYLGWCIDNIDAIQPTSPPYTNVMLYSTCDPNIDTNLPANYPDSVYVSQAAWHDVNYLINHKNGHYFYDIQEAMWTLIGGPADSQNFPPPTPQFDPAQVSAILADVAANAGAWQPQAGDVIAAVVAIQATPHDQLTIIEVPSAPPCTVTFTKTPTNMDLGCNPASIPDCTGTVDTNIVNAVSSCSNQITITCSKSDSTANCKTFRTITYVATDGSGNAATNSYTVTWITDTNAPTITVVPASTNYGCNPTSLPTDSSIQSQVSATDGCSPAIINVSHADSGSPCAMVRKFTITATDGCKNTATAYVSYYWKVDVTAPTITSIPASTNYGCNPAALPTDGSVKALVSATDNCGSLTITVTHQDGGTTCAMTRAFTITVTDGCNNSTATNVTYYWKVDTTAPTIATVPQGTNYGCNSVTLPTDASIQALVAATDTCSTPTISVTHVDVTSNCVTTRTFTITAKDDCGNVSAAKTVVYSVGCSCTSLGHGDTATIGFWHNKNGQALINAQTPSTALATWLASNFPYLYGANAPAGDNLTGKTDATVAALFITFFNVKGQNTDAQIMAGALATYVTTSSLGGTTASKYGFNISSGGTGGKTYNVGSDGTAIGLSNNTSYTVSQLLQQANLLRKNGLYTSAVANAFNDIFNGINQGGDII